MNYHIFGEERDLLMRTFSSNISYVGLTLEQLNNMIHIVN